MAHNSKMMVRRVMALLSQGTSEPYGTLLLLNTKRVIKTIETFRTRGNNTLPIRGKTMLGYFICVLRVLKEMEFLEVPGAAKARKILQDYKDKNYQQFALIKGPPVKTTSQVRKEVVDEHKETFQEHLAKVIFKHFFFFLKSH